MVVVVVVVVVVMMVWCAAVVGAHRPICTVLHRAGTKRLGWAGKHMSLSHPDVGGR